MSDRFERHAFTFTALTLVSRFTGLAREAALSRVFGVGIVMDAFTFAFMVPNLFRRLFGEGALAAAFVPIYTQLDRDDPAMARKLATLLIGGLIIVLGGITLLGEIALFAFSHAQDHDHLAARLMMITLPYMPLVCLVAILGAMLQVHGRFGPSAAAPVILNLCVITAAILFGFQNHANPDQRTHISLVAASIIAAGAIQVAWMLLALRKHHWFESSTRQAGGALRRVIAQAGPMILGLGVRQLNTFIDGLIASYPATIGATIFGIEYPLKEGAMASLSYAQRLYEFPLGVFGIAVATAIFPALARLAPDRAAFADTLRRGLRLVIFIGLPASAGLMLVREPLTAVILQGGDFTAADTARVSFVLLGYAPAIWAYSMTHVLTRAFYAHGDSKTPVKVAVSIVGLNLILNCTLIWTALNVAGLAWSTAICAVVQVIILLRLVRRHSGPLVGPPVWQNWMKSAIVTATMAAAVWIVSQLLPETLTGWWGSVAELAALVATGAIVVVLGSLSLKMPELAWALGRGSESSAVSRD